MTSDKTTTVPTEPLRALFDLAVNSLNFGSGFWEHEDTVAAIVVAEALGLNKWIAVPTEHRSNFDHAFRQDPRWTTEGCRFCGKQLDHGCHPDGAAVAPDVESFRSVPEETAP